MKRNCILVMALVLMLALSFYAQDGRGIKIESFDYKVAIKNAGPIVFDSAYMEKVIEKADGESSEKFLLTFSIPKTLQPELSKTTLKLFAYDRDGRILCAKIWHRIPFSALEESSGESLPVRLEVNPNFVKASRFSLQAGPLELTVGDGDFDSSSATCPGCVDLAVSTCGAGRVASVRCGTTKDGSTCEFTCKP